MRLNRRCPSLRSLWRSRFSFRTFIVTLAAVYFTAMYLFHRGLDGPPRDRVPDSPQRWAAGGADAVGEEGRERRKTPKPRMPANVVDRNLQDAFDDIRRQDLQQQRFDELHDEPQVDGQPGPVDVNIPPSCNSSTAGDRRLSGGEFLQLGDAYILSGFWDDRPNDFDNQHNGSLVRIMAAMRDSTHKSRRLVCDFGSVRSPISIYEMCENHHRPYGSFILSCHVPDGVVDAPCFVTVRDEAAAAGGVDVRIRTLRPRTLSHSFTVCVPPLFGDVPPARLVEFFELTFLLGAEHIVMYEWNTSPATRAVVQRYGSRCRDERRCRRVEVISWRIPDHVATGIWYNGQSLAIQDCLYRQMASSRYVMFGDIDEYLVPHGKGLVNWTQLVPTLDRRLSCAFQFRSAFFDPAAPGPPVSHALPSPIDTDLRRRKAAAELLTMRSTERSKHFSEVRTKCMVRPYEIFEAGIHHISKPIWAHLAVDRVDTELAFVHHYRNCIGTYGMNCEGTVQDPAMHRYLDELLNATSLSRDQLTDVL